VTGGKKKYIEMFSSFTEHYCSHMSFPTPPPVTRIGYIGDRELGASPSPSPLIQLQA